MLIFWNTFLKITAIFISIITIILIAIIFTSFFEKNDRFTFLSGDEKSSNVIAILELNGLIIDTNTDFANLSNIFSISPVETKKKLEFLEEISPKTIIFSINSPGGTVGASKKIYEIIKNYKKNNNDTKILFHTNQLLASGGYWVATAADEIYASYGSIIGSIGVKGPDWFFYDEPKTISTGIFGNIVETKNGIKIFSNSAGKSKDIFNPFRKPSKSELDHLQGMVDEIYNDFVSTVSKERKIEIETIVNDIGALIYTTNSADNFHLIDGQLNLDNLIKKTINESDLKNYKVIKLQTSKNSLIKEFLINNLYNNNIYTNNKCLNLRSSMAAILSYETIGC